MELNKYLSTPDSLNLELYPAEIKEDFYNFVTNVPYIKNLISIDRPKASDCPRDDLGRIIVDLTNPPIIEDTDYFRPTAIYFLEHGVVSNLRPNPNPNSEYGKWVREEIRRCFMGYVRPSDGAWVTGDMYFFLNYCPIIKVKKVKGKKGIRVVDFPDFLEGQWLKFMYIHLAREAGKHGSELAARGRGKAHPYDEIVYTPEGMKLWEEIKIGDYIFGDDGNVTKVTAIPFNGVAPIYELTLSSGYKVRCSEGHLWTVHSHTRGNITISTKELLNLYKRPRKITQNNPKGYELDCTIPVGNGAQFPYKETKVDPYTFGLLLGDGCFRNKGYKNKVNIIAKDEDFEVYKKYIPYKSHIIPSGKYLHSIEITDIHNILSSYNLNYTKSENKFIPQEYKYNSKDVRIALLKGLLDADGTVTNGKIELVLTSKQLISDVLWICSSLGIATKNTKPKNTWYYNNRGEKVKCLPAYRLSIFSNLPLFNLPRKLQLWQNRSKTAYAQSKYNGYKIVDIKYIGEQKSKCVTVDNKSHCYLINNFIVTHNSFTMAAIMAKRFILGEYDEIDHKITTKVETFCASYLKNYLNEDGVLNKFESYIDFCSEYTQFPKKRLISSMNNMHWQMGYKDNNSEAKKGSLNEVIGISVKDSEGKLRGKRGAFIGLEEFGCHIKGTKILLYNGYVKNVEDVTINDVLMGDDGTPREILHVHNGIDLLYKIILSNGDYHIVNSKHLIYFKKYNWSNRTYVDNILTPELFLLLKDTNKGYYIPKAVLNLQHKDVDIDPYYLGLWLGDGDSSRLDVANEDLEVLTWLLQSFNGGYIRNLKQSNTCKIFHLSKRTHVYNKLFLKYNLFNNKHVPEDYKINSNDIQLKVIAGLIDSDGTLNRNKNYFEITQRFDRKHILDDIKFMCECNGLKCSMTSKITTGKKPGVLHYRLRISGDISIVPTKIERKKGTNKHPYRGKNKWNYYTFKVLPYSVGEYYGFTTSGNHLYCLSDLTITHNSFPNLIGLYGTLRPSMEDGDIVFGMIYCQGCVCAGTKVLKPNGEPINIENMLKGQKLLGYNGTTSTEENISWLLPKAYKQCVEITTEKNNSIRCSIDHPLLVLNKDRFGHSLKTCSFYRALELKVGDTLLMPRKVGRFGNIHVKDAYLLGALFGDGSYTDNSCITLSITSNEEYDYYNNNYDINISKLYTEGPVYALIYFRSLHPLLLKYRMDKQFFEKKRLPYNIFDWDKESVCNFLGGYFNADGNILIVKHKYRSIKLTCKYQDILYQVKQLLSKLGISSHIYRENKISRVLRSRVNNKSYKMPETTSYVLYISNSIDVCIFKDNIHLLIKEKQARLDSYVPTESKGVVLGVSFVLRDNNKGKNLEGNTFYDLLTVAIKSIKDIGVLRIYNMTADTTHTYLTNGFLSSNTSGDKESDFKAAQLIMYAPRAFNMYPIRNVYDKVGQGKPEFVYFYPAYVNRNGCYSKDGISDVTKAILEVLINRYNVKYNTSNMSLITKTIAEHPITPLEAIMKTLGNMFPTQLLNERINQIDSNPNEFDDVYVGTLVQQKNGKVEFKPTLDLPVREFPTEDNKEKGAIEIFSMPEIDREGNVYRDRYIIGHDPVDDDSSNTMSLTSTFVLDLFTDKIVAEYTGRLAYADDNFEIVRKLCLFYNAKCMYEQNKKGIFAYFSKMNCLYLLAETPQYLKDQLIIKEIGYGNKARGVNATHSVNVYADLLTKEWLIKPINIPSKDGLEEVSIPNLMFIKNRAFLLELASYNPNGNFDRVRAFGMLMLYRQEKIILYQGDMKRTIEVDDINNPANDDFFTINYDNRF